MTTANAHALFNGLKSQPSYLARLTIGDDERRSLMVARGLVREQLRNAFSKIIDRDDVWEEAYRNRVRKADRRPILVKFMTQGSFAYKTLNLPAYVTLQEIDLDDGMYVPVQFLENGEPSLVARSLFGFVEQALEPLCAQHNWELDRTKSSCVRVKLWRGAHIDIPIYSIPQEQFEQLVEKFVAASAGRFADRQIAKDEAFKLPTDKIMLAQRDGTWNHSDPQKLHDWVESRVALYGPIYRRLCRFFKGWRDYTWQKSALTSLCIMHAIDIALAQIGGIPADNRDDEMILKVANKLPDILSNSVCNPVIREKCLNEWSEQQRREIVVQVDALRSSMIAALEQSQTPERVLSKLFSKFGDRIPNAPEAITFATSKIEAIRIAPAIRVAAPAVISSTSG